MNSSTNKNIRYRLYIINKIYFTNNEKVCDKPTALVISYQNNYKTENFDINVNIYKVKNNENDFI